MDFGEVRIGLALSDETGTLASPLATLRRRRGKRPPLAQIEAAAREHHVGDLVVGLPLDLSGDGTAWSDEVRKMAIELAHRLALPLHLVDERMTSVRAERAIRSIGLPRGKREDKDRVDAAAAAIILQGWLDRKERGQ